MKIITLTDLGAAFLCVEPVGTSLVGTAGSGIANVATA